MDQVEMKIVQFLEALPESFKVAVQALAWMCDKTEFREWVTTMATTGKPPVWYNVAFWESRFARCPPWLRCAVRKSVRESEEGRLAA
jgi:hypothetical protein